MIITSPVVQPCLHHLVFFIVAIYWNLAYTVNRHTFLCKDLTPKLLFFFFFQLNNCFIEEKKKNEITTNSVFSELYFTPGGKIWHTQCPCIHYKFHNFLLTHLVYNHSCLTYNSTLLNFLTFLPCLLQMLLCLFFFTCLPQQVFNPFCLICSSTLLASKSIIFHMTQPFVV